MANYDSQFLQEISRNIKQSFVFRLSPPKLWAVDGFRPSIRLQQTGAVSPVWAPERSGLRHQCVHAPVQREQALHAARERAQTRHAAAGTHGSLRRLYV